MSLLLLDLDNTLADREGALRAWATDRASEWAAGDPEAVRFLIKQDADGLVSRDEFARNVITRFGLYQQPAEFIAQLRAGLLDALPPLSPIVVDRICALRIAGWRTAIVTNGRDDVQQAKLRRLGALELLDAVCTSGALGIRKPDPRIFERAAADSNASLQDGWMIGDSEADIVGAHNARVRSIWLHRGRVWRRDDIAPTLIADNLSDALALLH